MELIVTQCGCLPCLLMGYLDIHTSIEHVTERGRRIGKGPEQHRWTIGLCAWHHFGHTNNHRSRQWMSGEFGPTLAWGRVNFEDHFGDEVNVLVPVQDFMLAEFARKPWPEYTVARDIARNVQHRWIELNSANEKTQLRERPGSS